jgi:CBS domain containing-hemolysin-like protein
MITDVLTPIGVILLLVAANGLFVAAEFSLVSARRSRLDPLAEAGNGSARWLLDQMARPTGKDSYIAVAQLGITLASIGLGMYGEPAVAAWLYGPFERLGLGEDASHSVGFVIALSGITFLHVVLGEMIPKALALQSPETVAVAVTVFMRAFGLVMRPFVWFLNTLAMAMMRLLGVREPGKSASLYTSKELAILTDEVAESGQLPAAQRTLIHNILELEDRTVEQLMTSRSRLAALDVHISPEDLSRHIASNPLSRYPVYEGNLDLVIGVLHVKDFIRARAKRRPIDLRALIRDLPSISATTTADELLAVFKRSRVHAALVVDEFGGTLGFVTMNDLIAEVIDEESPADADRIRSRDDGSLSLDGEVTLAELEEDYQIVLEHGDVVTVAGLFLSHHGTLPKVGTTVRVEEFTLSVEEMQGLKITRLRLVRNAAG